MVVGFKLKDIIILVPVDCYVPYLEGKEMPESVKKSGEIALSYRQGNLSELHDNVTGDAIIKIGFVKPKK